MEDITSSLIFTQIKQLLVLNKQHIWQKPVHIKACVCAGASKHTVNILSSFILAISMHESIIKLLGFI